MNVLFVHFGDDWLAGSEIALLEMLKEFPKQGVTPTLWCNGAQMAEAAGGIGISVEREDFRLYFHPDAPPFSPRHYLARVRNGVRQIARSKADIVHCNSGAPAQWMLPAGRLRGVPVLVNSHSPYIRHGRYTMGLHLADRVVCVASAIAQPLLTDGMDAARVTVVYNGFDEESLMQGDASDLRKSLGIPEDAVVAAIAGSLIHRKGHDILFAAMRRLGGGAVPFHLLVMGDGPQEAEFRVLADGLPVHFLGRRDDIGPVLRDAVDFLVAPSREEAFGRVIVEAAFAGVPAIGANVDGIPEAIDDGRTGVLVSPADPGALAETIRRLVGDRALRQSLGAAAQGRARRLFSIGQCTRQMVGEYAATIERRRARPFWRPDLSALRPYFHLLR